MEFSMLFIGNILGEYLDINSLKNKKEKEFFNVP